MKWSRPSSCDALPAATDSLLTHEYGFLPLMQVAAFVGIWGITFVIAWFASTFDMAWTRSFDLGVVRTAVLTYTAVAGAIVAGGSVRLALAPTVRASIRIATINRPADLFVPGEMTRIQEGRLSPDEHARLAGKLTRLHDAFLEGSRREARAGARLVAWPETSLLVFRRTSRRSARRAAGEAVYLTMGLGTVRSGRHCRLNKAGPRRSVQQNGVIGSPRRGGHRKPHETQQRPCRSATLSPVGRDLLRRGFPEFIRQAGRALPTC